MNEQVNGYISLFLLYSNNYFHSIGGGFLPPKWELQ